MCVGLAVFNHNRAGTATAIADGCTTIFAVVLLEYVQQCNQNARTRSTQWVSQSNRTTVHIYFARIQVQQLVVGQGYNGESFI